MRAAVIGAGVAGLVCARELSARGAEVTVFEKSRGPGGRLSTRRAGDLRFDHGCAALARGSWLSQLPASDVQLGDFAGRLVPEPTMSALCNGLAAGLTLSTSARVGTITPREGGGFALRGASGEALGDFERVAVTVPAPQAADLLADAAPMLAEVAAGAAYSPCWAVMAAWDSPLAIEDDWHRDPKPATPVAWAARESAKPGRSGGERWTVQAGPGWSAAHLGDHPDAVARELLAALGVTLLAGPLPPPEVLLAHCWRYARVTAPLPQLCLVDAQVGIGAGGDWCAPMLEPAALGADQDDAGVPQALSSGRALAAVLSV